MSVPSFPPASVADHEEGFLNSKDHLRLFWQRYTPKGGSRATVAILHGGGDHSGRYPGITAALVEAGFTAALVDFRGHGQSDGRRWYVDHFSDYLDDLDAFLAKLAHDRPAEPLFLVAHSQGAHIAALWGLTPGRNVAGFVLSSPYLKLAMRPPAAKVLGAQLAGRVVPWLPVSTGIKLEDLTSDPELQRWTEHDRLYGRSTTPRWFNESRAAQAEVLRRAKDFSYPLLVLAGGADPIADIAAMRAFADAAGSKDKALEVYEGFRHELFNEVGRERPIGDAVAWIRTRSGGARPESR